MRLLGLDIAEREVRVARGERTFGVLKLIALERIPYDDPASLATLLADLARPRADLVLTALPAACATHRFLRLPFRDRRRLARTAPLELLGQLPLDGDGLTVGVEPLGPAPGGTTVLAAAARRAEVDAHAALLAAAGLPPARVDLAPLPAWNLVPPGDDAALLVADGRRCALALRRGGRLVGLRAIAAPASDHRALAAEVRWSLAALGGAPLVVIAGAETGDALASALAAATGARVVPIAAAAPLGLPPGASPEDLSAGAVAAGLVAGAGRRERIGLVLGGDRSIERGSLRRSAALALAALLVGGVDLGLARFELARRDAALVRAIQAEARAVLPDIALTEPRAQLESALAAASRRAVRLGGDTSALDLLRELSARVPAALRLDLDELTIERDGVVLHGRAESFAAVDALRRALAGSERLSEVAAEETRATVDGRRVEFRLRAGRRPAGGASS